jgi:signal transduction histidine kinase
MVREACDHLHARAEIKQQSLEARLEPDAWIQGDPSLVRRLIHILVDNAIKYTGPKGFVTVTVRKQKSDVVLEVRDTALGSWLARKKTSSTASTGPTLRATAMKEEGD